MDRNYKVASFLPEAVSGSYRIERFEVTGTEWQGLGPRQVPKGVYTRLMREGTVVMSDTPDEYRDHIYFIHAAKGHVLIAGLGLGMVANVIARKPEVERVTIVEVSEDVIALTGPALKAVHGDKVEIVHGSIFDYQPPKGTVYSALWFDIWDTICADNLPEMAKLHRKFARRKAGSDTFVGSWARIQCMREQRHWKNSYWGQMER